MPVPTPATKIARAVTPITANPTMAGPAARAEKTPQPPQNGQVQLESAPEETPDQAMPSDLAENEAPLSEVSASGGIQVSDPHLIGLASLGIAVFLGIGSVFFAGIAAYLLARVILRS